MTSSSLYLAHTSINGGTPVKVLGSQLTYAGKKNLDAKPIANVGSIVEVQTVTKENPNMVVQSVHLAIPSAWDSVTGSTLTFPQVLTLWALRNTPGQEVILSGTYENGMPIPNSALTSTSVKVVLSDFSTVFDTKDTKDSSIPIASLTFKETA